MMNAQKRKEYQIRWHKLDKVRHPERYHYYEVKWRANNRAKCKNNSRVLIKQNKELINDIKTHTPCADCGLHFPHWIMEFDHVTEEKNFCLGTAQGSIYKILSEMMICDLVCANCHRTRTYRRRNGIPTNV